jgi:hypothetical protein
MTQAQYALNLQTAAPPNQTVFQAIGAGIGNNAAHEIGHQLGVAGDDDSINTYNSGSCDGSKAPWVFTSVGPDGKTPISWEGKSAESLQSIVSPGGTH